MGKLVNVSVKVPEELRRLMRELDVDWGEYLREAIRVKVREELAKRVSRRLDEIRSSAKRISTEVLVEWIREGKVVLDAGVVAKWAIPGERWEEEALTVKEKLVSGELRVYAPSLLAYELASVMLRAVKGAALGLKEALEALDAIGSLGI